MMMTSSARLGLPLLAPGQAGKEIAHNEALVRLDIAACAVVEGAARMPPPAPAPGACWIVEDGATGEWLGQDGAVAGWTDAGWRFVQLPVGGSVRIAQDGGWADRTEAGWRRGALVGTHVLVDGQSVVSARGAAVTGPAGGSTVDNEARQALTQLLERLRDHGLIAR